MKEVKLVMRTNLRVCKITEEKEEENENAVKDDERHKKHS